MKGKSQQYTYWLKAGTPTNDHVNSAALKKLSEEIEGMLAKKKWKMRRYFGRRGSLGSTWTMSTVSDESCDDDSSEPALNSAGSTTYTEDRFDTSNESDPVDDGIDCNIDDLDAFFQEKEPQKENDTNDDVCLFPERDWNDETTLEEVVSDLHGVLSPLLKKCLSKLSEADDLDNIDMLDGQLYGLIDKILKSFEKNNRFHNFKRSACQTVWANSLMKQAQDNSTSILDRDPWYRFALVVATLFHNCKHVGVENYQLEKEDHDMAQLYEKGCCHQERRSVEAGIAIFADCFPELYNEVLWGCPRFHHLVRSTVLAMESPTPSTSLQEALENTNSSSPRDVFRRTEAVMGGMFVLATLGDYAQSYDLFLQWNQARYDEVWAAFESNRGTDPRINWREKQKQLIQTVVLPLSKYCEQFLTSSGCSLHEQVSFNLKALEADGTVWSSKHDHKSPSIFDYFHSMIEQYRFQ